jgi:hypothetical protein
LITDILANSDLEFSFSHRYKYIVLSVRLSVI